MSDGTGDILYSRRRLLAAGASVGAGTFLLRAEGARAFQEPSPVSNWVIAKVQSEPARTSLEAAVLPSGRPLHVSLSPLAPATRPDGELQTEFRVGQTFAAEATSRPNQSDRAVVAHRLVPVVIGEAADARR